MTQQAYQLPLEGNPVFHPEDVKLAAAEWAKLGKKHPQYQRALDQIDDLEAAIEALFRYCRCKARVSPRSRAFQRLWELRPHFYNPVPLEVE